MPRLEQYRNALHYLHEQNLRYVILRNPPNFPINIKDVDIIVMSNDYDQVLNVFKKYEYEIIVSGGHTFVKKDKINIDINRKLEYLETEKTVVGKPLLDRIIEKRQIINELYFLPSDYEIMLLLLRMRSNNNYLTKYSAKIKRILPTLESLSEFPEFKDLNIDLEMIKKEFFAQNTQSYIKHEFIKKLKKIKKVFSYLLIYLNTIFVEKRLKAIVFLGPDGSGKTTITNRLTKQFPDKYYAITMAKGPKSLPFNKSI